MSGRRASRTQLRASSLESQESLRQNIIHAARDLFRHHGYEAVSMRRIAARIGYTVSAIYHYFPSKQSVLIHVWDEDLRYFASYVKGAVDQAETPVGKVQMIFMSYIRYWESNPDKFRLLFSPSSGVDRETRGREHEPVYATWLKSYSESREIVTRPGTPKERRFNGQAYLLSYGLPQFFFHVTTAYALLRHNGLELGKGDYMGKY